MKLRSFFPLNILLGDEDGEYPAASLSLQQPAKGGNIYLGAWFLSVSLSCLCQFYFFDITKILSSRQQEEEIHYGSSKIVLFFLEYPFHRAKNHISKFLPLLRREKSFQNSITFWRNGCDFPSCSTWDIHWMFVQYKQHTVSAMWWEGALCLVQVKHWHFSGPGHRIEDVSGGRRLPMRVVISTGASQRVVLNFESCLVKFLLLANPWVFFHLLSPACLFLLSPFSLCIAPYISFHRNFLLGGVGQGICCIQSCFLLITVFLTLMISKDTFRIWENKRTRQWHQYSFWHREKMKWHSLNVYAKGNYNSSTHCLNNNILLSLNGKAVIWIQFYEMCIFFLYLIYCGLRALVLFCLVDLLPILELMVLIPLNWCLPNTFQMTNKFLGLK